VFAGGIGENSSVVRSRICEGLGCLGIQLDGTRNAAGDPVISADARGAQVRVIRTDEEIIIARTLFRILDRDFGASTRGSVWPPIAGSVHVSILADQPNNLTMPS
jgi:acetate kinase